MGCICKSHRVFLFALHSPPSQFRGLKLNEDVQQLQLCSRTASLYTYPSCKQQLRVKGSSTNSCWHSYLKSERGTRTRWPLPITKERGGRIRAGAAKNIGTVVAAISVPILLVLITVIVSIIIAEKLDREFEEEVARKCALMKRRGLQQDTLDGGKEETDRVLSTARNRPKREE